MADEVVDLAMLRRRVGLTQQELAWRLGVRQATISDWERGRSEPTMSVTDMDNLCKVLGITFDELVVAIRNIKNRSGIPVEGGDENK